MTRPRLRDLGIQIGTGTPGQWNAITDVPDVRVGHSTLIRGDGPLLIGEGPVRTGVTAVLPHGGRSIWSERCPAAIQVLNGAGEMTGWAAVEEWGVLSSPILITTTMSVGQVHQATVKWMLTREPVLGADDWVVPVVAETYDGHLNDAIGQHVTEEHTFAALDGAATGPVAEGCVGGGTGMMLFELKGGVGTASRLIELGGQTYTVGVLVQGNCGSLDQLRVDGVPVGRILRETWPEHQAAPERQGRDGSIIIVIATDAAMSDRQLRRLCKRGMLGLGRTGASGHHSSGDILIAFSNAPENRVSPSTEPLLQHLQLNDRFINPFFTATIEATEEAVLNAMVAAETMVGINGNWAHALPHDRLVEIMEQHARLRG